MGEYEKLVKDLNARYPDGIHLPPEYASIIQNNMLSLLIRLARYKFASKMLKKGDSVLDIGCSTGLGTIFLGQNCKKILGIDMCKSDIEWAKKISQRTNVTFKHLNFSRMKTGTLYDVITTLDVIEHFPQEQGELFIEKIASCLKDNGMLILGTPSYYIRDYQNAFSKAAHVKCYDLPELVGLVDKYFGRTLSFSMNDELVHTGFHKVAWYYFVLAFYPKRKDERVDGG